MWKHPYYETFRDLQREMFQEELQEFLLEVKEKKEKLWPNNKKIVLNTLAT